jgi:aspartate aminotransferase
MRSGTGWSTSLKRTGAFPLVDLAYLGFGDGLEEDAYGVRKVVSAVPESMVAFSASKNFGLYRERAGVAIAIAHDSERADVVSSQMQNVIRATISQTPDHGAEIVQIILERQGPARRVGSRAHRNAGTHEAPARQAGRSDQGPLELGGLRFHRRAHRHVLAARLPEDVVTSLKVKDAIYMINDSRINVAGIPEDRVGELADKHAQRHQTGPVNGRAACSLRRAPMTYLPDMHEIPGGD